MDKEKRRQDVLKIKSLCRTLLNNVEPKKRVVLEAQVKENEALLERLMTDEETAVEKPNAWEPAPEPDSKRPTDEHKKRPHKVP